MSLQDLGSIGELVGGFAIVVSLIYVALQIRQNTRQVSENTRSVQRDSWRNSVQDANSWRYSLIHHPDVADLYRRGLRDAESLGSNDWLRFRLLLDSLFYHWLYMFLNREEIGDPDPNAVFVSRLLSEPGGQRYWDSSRFIFAGPYGSFAEYVDMLASRLATHEAGRQDGASEGPE